MSAALPPLSRSSLSPLAGGPVRSAMPVPPVAGAAPARRARPFGAAAGQGARAARPLLAAALAATLTASALLPAPALAQTAPAPGSAPPAPQTEAPAPPAAPTAPAAPAAPATPGGESAPSLSGAEGAAPATPGSDDATPGAPAGDGAAQGTDTAPAPPVASETGAPGTDTGTPAAGVDAPGATTTTTTAPEASTAIATDADPAGAPAGVDPATLPHDLSPMGMFLAADWVVKGVMIGLAFASLVTWTVLIAKMLEYLGATRTLRRGLRIVLAAGSLGEAAAALEGRRDAVARMTAGALLELERSAPALDHGGAAGVKERVASLLARAEHGAVRRLNRGTGLLATIGSTAPFVGLFGTVWGIMNSFIGISESQTTNLAVVAPGIAEALLATAIGLVAAIPAVVIYNVFARWISGYRAMLGDAAAGVERLVSRDLDFGRIEAETVLRRAAE